LNVLMPATWAASSSSRTAIMLRPCRDRTRLASSTTPMTSSIRMFQMVVDGGMPGQPRAPPRPWKLSRISLMASPKPSVAMQK